VIRPPPRNTTAFLNPPSLRRRPPAPRPS
jgi:hypothetical protein